MRFFTMICGPFPPFCPRRPCVQVPRASGPLFFSDHLLIDGSVRILFLSFPYRPLVLDETHVPHRADCFLPPQHPLVTQPLRDFLGVEELEDGHGELPGGPGEVAELGNGDFFLLLQMLH